MLLTGSMGMSRFSFTGRPPGSGMTPNGSRLCCGANAGGRKRPALGYRRAGAQSYVSLCMRVFMKAGAVSFKRLLGGALATRCPRSVQIRLRHARRLCWGISRDLEALSGGEHGPAHRDITGERLEAEGWAVHVHVDAFHSPAHEIRFMPEPRAAGVTNEVLPPDAVRL